MTRHEPNQPAAARNLISPLSRFPSGESRGGRVPPTPRTLAASKPRRLPSMPQLPPQEGFQSAPLKSPLRDPPAGHGSASKQRSKKTLADQWFIKVKLLLS